MKHKNLVRAIAIIGLLAIVIGAMLPAFQAFTF